MAEAVNYSNLFLAPLPKSVRNDDLQEIFKAHGATSASVMMDVNSGRSKGFAFIAFETSEEGEVASKELNGKSCVSPTGETYTLNLSVSSHKKHQSVIESNVVYFRNLPLGCSVSDIKATLEKFGEISNISTKADPQGKFMLATVDYTNLSGAKQAVNEGHGKVLFPLQSTFPIMCKYADNFATKQARRLRRQAQSDQAERGSFSSGGGSSGFSSGNDWGNGSNHDNDSHGNGSMGNNPLSGHGQGLPQLGAAMYNQQQQVAGYGNPMQAAAGPLYDMQQQQQPQYMQQNQQYAQPQQQYAVPQQQQQYQQQQPQQQYQQPQPQQCQQQAPYMQQQPQPAFQQHPQQDPQQQQQQYQHQQPQQPAYQQHPQQPQQQQYQQQDPQQQQQYYQQQLAYQQQQQQQQMFNQQQQNQHQQAAQPIQHQQQRNGENSAYAWENVSAHQQQQQQQQQPSVNIGVAPVTITINVDAAPVTPPSRKTSTQAGAFGDDDPLSHSKEGSTDSEHTPGRRRSSTHSRSESEHSTDSGKYRRNPYSQHAVTVQVDKLPQ